MLDGALFVALAVLVAALTFLVIDRVLFFYRGIDCRHLNLKRYWFPRHRFHVVCQDCRRIVEKGRDVYHVRKPGQAA